MKRISILAAALLLAAIPSFAIDTSSATSSSRYGSTSSTDPASSTAKLGTSSYSSAASRSGTSVDMLSGLKPEVGGFTMNSEDSTSGIGDRVESMQGMVLLAMTNPDYRVTPGDVYNLSFITSVGPQTTSLFVNTDWTVNLSTMGTMKAEGLSFQAFRAKVLEKVERSYPLSSPQLVVTSTGAFQVICRGEVMSVIEDSAWGLTRLSTLVMQHITPYSSMRNIKIVGRDGTEKICDLFKASRDGDLSQDPYLKPGDQIVLDRFERQVSIIGEVERPGTYELLKGENLKELVERYGHGFTLKADSSRLRMERFTQASSKSGEVQTFAYSTEQKILEDRDTITVSMLQDLLPVIFFEGAIVSKDPEKMAAAEKTSDAMLTATQKIPYQFYQGDTLDMAVRSLRTSFTEYSDLERAYLRRGLEIRAIDLSKYLYDKDFSDNIVLKPNDILVVPFKQYFVSVSGAVLKPGRYPWVPDRNWKYYAGLAGGIDEEKNSGNKVVIEDLNDNALSMTDVIPPECKITAKSNSFLYNFKTYSPVITVMLTAISTTLTAIALTQ